MHKPLVLSLAVLAIACASESSSSTFDPLTVPDGGAPSFPDVSDFAARGSFRTLTESSPAKCKVFRPRTLGESGRVHPLVVWGNGTLGFPAVYSGLLDHWASHGFIVIAANTTNAGTGEEMLACMAWVFAENARAASAYFGHVDVSRVAASGHSQGGGGAIMLGRDTRITTTVPLMPYIEGLGHDPASESQQHGPMFLLSGRTDTIAPAARDQAPVFEVANAPVFWGLLETAGHVAALGDAGHFRGPMTAWLRARLMDDASARALFEGPSCGLCTDRAWTVERRGIP